MIPNKTHNSQGSVVDEAQGKWLEIFYGLAPEMRNAVIAAATNQGHVPCPVHGGTDGFRFFNDGASRGASICNTCGAFSSGMKTAAWLNQNGKLKMDETYCPPTRRNDESDESYLMRDTYKKVAHYLNHAHDKYPKIDLDATPMNLLGGGNTDTRTREEKDANEKANATKFWQAACDENKVEILYGYFEHRGLQNIEIPPILKVASDVPYTSKTEPTSYHYCILAPLAFTKFMPETQKHERKFIAMQYIYLDPVPYSKKKVPIPTDFGNPLNAQVRAKRFLDTNRFKKADVANAKKTMRWEDYMGASVMLYGPTNPSVQTKDILIVGEGIETVLAFAHMCPLKVPTYASLVANNLAAFVIPEDLESNLKTILVASDFDKSNTGNKVVEELRIRLASTHPGIRVVDLNPGYLRDYCRQIIGRALAVPPDEVSGLYPKGIDWDNILAVANNIEPSLLARVAEDIGLLLKNTPANSVYAEALQEFRQFNEAIYTRLENLNDVPMFSAEPVSESPI